MSKRGDFFEVKIHRKDEDNNFADKTLTYKFKK